MALSVLNIKTNDMEDLPLTIPFPDRSGEGLASIGGLACDGRNDQIFFSMEKDIMQSLVRKSNEGKPFENVAQLPIIAGYNIACLDFAGWSVCCFLYESVYL